MSYAKAKDWDYWTEEEIAQIGTTIFRAWSKDLWEEDECWGPNCGHFICHCERNYDDEHEPVIHHHARCIEKEIKRRKAYPENRSIKARCH